ncbi:ABC transporter ATP-binding protein/permease [Suttonella sp. R2A3]|uniref:ABC transporter ATP-binding protein n=1 Tax=Suttonella sp. R2A3 TaxID=2908648 RepID=UPI001F2C6061|nr:ABC transporter ATP-binding protein [Suttonella sp. R2A3]UJF25127.1 ABC transporter ATP-binding protein/permease [Suttonella sp. R2A3]
MNKQPSKSFSHWHIIAPVKKTIYFAMAVAVLAAACALFTMLLLAGLIRQLIAQPDTVAWTWFLTALLFAIFAYIFRSLSFKYSHLAAFALEPILRRQISDHLVQVPLGTLSEQGSAALTKVIQDDVRDLHAFVADATPLYARAYAAPIFTILLLFVLDWRLALVALAVLIIGMLILSLAMKNANETHHRYNKARETVNQAVIEFVQAMPVVRTFDGGRASFGRYEQALDRYLEVLTGWYKQSGPPAKLSMIILNPMPTLIVLLWAGCYWLWQDSLSFSTWLAVLLLGTGMAEALMPYMALYHLIDKAKISIHRITDVLHLPLLPITDTPQEPQDASVVFEAVDFRYGNRTENALSDVSFSVPSGSFTALVGASGAGKSTVARLLPRFWDVTSGSIKIGGVDVRDILPEVLMQQVAFVFQDTFLFSGSIAENIRLGLPDASDTAVIAAAQSAQAHEFISQLPQGYKTQVGERGASLSGGQRQRIAIARAILQNRPILLLDEATAFADAENEALLMKALHTLMQGKTVLMIAHRLATIQHAEQILMFADGHLVEAGKPETLLKQGGAYAELWQAYQSAQNWTIRN